MKNNKSTISKWKKHYAGDQENLYKSIFIRLLFDLGHKYIAHHGKKMSGPVLDIGSGMGYHLKFEKISKERQYICLDNDPKMLKKIRDSNVKKIVGTCSNIPLKDKSVSVVIASHILEHLPNLRADIKEIKRVLKDDGKLIVVLPCDPGLLWRISTYITPSRWRLKKLGIDYDEVMRHEHVNSFEKCMSELRKSFNIENRRFYPFALNSYHVNILCGITLIKK